MKSIISLFVLVSLAVSNLMLSSNAFASDYVGDICWQVLDYTGMGKHATAKLGVSDMGSGHFQLNGVLSLDGHQALLTGNAGLIGDLIEVQLFYSDYAGGEIITGVINMSLSLLGDKLDGTYVRMEMHNPIINGAGVSPVSYGYLGSVTTIQCQQ